MKILNTLHPKMRIIKKKTYFFTYIIIIIDRSDSLNDDTDK